MPSILNSSGFPRTARPNIYTKVDASQLAGGDVSTGNLAVVGDFPSFPSLTPVTFGSRRSLVAFDSKNPDLAMIAQLAFSGSNDPNSNQGAATVTVVNTREACLQANLTIGGVTLKSKVHGLAGRTLRSTLSFNNSVYSLTIDRLGLSESYDIEVGDVASITNSTGGAVTVSSEEGVFKIEDANNAVLASFNASETPTLKDVISQVNNLNGFTATLIEPKAIKLEELDYFSVAIADGATAQLEANNNAIFTSLAFSDLVEVSIDNSNTAAAINTGTLYASGHNQGNLNTAGALAAIENLNVQILVLMDFTESSQLLLANHLDQAAKAGYERQAYVGIEKTSNVSTIKNRAKLLNRPDIALASQAITLFDSKGLKVEKDARFTALLFAGMQAGSDTGEPLTRKKPSVLSTVQNYDTHLDAENVLRSGSIFISMGTTGPRVERSITTYLEDNNPILSEVSAYESILTSLRDLRTALQDQIGRPTKASQFALIESRVTARLSQQTKDGLIKAFTNISIEDLGDQVAVSYDVAPLEPLNFLTLTAIAKRID